MRYAIRWFKCKLKPPKNEIRRRYRLSITWCGLDVRRILLMILPHKYIWIHVQLHWRIQGGTLGTPPSRSNFFHFHTFFWQKSCQIIGFCPLTRLGNPGSTTELEEQSDRNLTTRSKYWANVEFLSWFVSLVVI